jgi:hypothetical protein
MLHFFNLLLRSWCLFSGKCELFLRDSHIFLLTDSFIETIERGLVLLKIIGRNGVRIVSYVVS